GRTARGSSANRRSRSYVRAARKGEGATSSASPTSLPCRGRIPTSCLRTDDTCLRVLDDDVPHAMGGGLAGVDRVLERLVDVLPANHDHRVDPIVLEQARARGPRDVVAPVLDALDLDDPV